MPKIQPGACLHPLLLSGSCFTLHKTLQTSRKGWLGRAVQQGQGWGWGFCTAPCLGQAPQLWPGGCVFSLPYKFQAESASLSLNWSLAAPQGTFFPGAAWPEPSAHGDRGGQCGLDRGTCPRVTCPSARLHFSCQELSSSCISISKRGFHQAYLSW